METPAGGTSQVSEIFGYAVPGYALASIIIAPLALSFPSFVTLWAAIVAVSGLPIGFVWVYGVYNPIFWARSSSRRQWVKFLQDAGNQILPEIAPQLSDRGRANLAKLQQDQEEVFLLMDRVSAKLREDYPFLAFFHVRHHTLRNLAYILWLFAVPMLSLASLADFVTRGVSMGLAIQAAILLVSLVVSLICFISAGLEFSTALRTFRFRFALDWQKIAESMKLYLESPVLTT